MTKRISLTHERTQEVEVDTSSISGGGSATEQVNVDIPFFTRNKDTLTRANDCTIKYVRVVRISGSGSGFTIRFNDQAGDTFGAVLSTTSIIQELDETGTRLDYNFGEPLHYQGAGSTGKVHMELRNDDGSNAATYKIILGLWPA